MKEPQFEEMAAILGGMVPYLTLHHLVNITPEEIRQLLMAFLVSGGGAMARFLAFKAYRSYQRSQAKPKNEGRTPGPAKRRGR